MSYKDGFKEQTVAAGQNIKERDYWLKKFSGEITRTTLPHEYRQPGAPTHEAHEGHEGHEAHGGNPLTAALPFRVTGPAHTSLLKISNKSDVRLHILLVTGWLILLHRYTSAADIIVGVPVYSQEVEGRLINTVLALRNTVDGRMTVKELLVQVGQTILEANQNQNYPIDALVYKLNLPGAGGDFPLFDMSILLEEIHDKHYLDHIRQNIVLSFHKTNEALAGNIAYNDRLYDEPFMERLINHYRQILESALANVETPIGQVEVITAQEKQQLLNVFNGNKTDFPREKTLSQVFSEQCERTPHNIAVGLGGTGTGEKAALTYRDLEEQVRGWAGVLTEKGVVPETIVGVMMPRSLEMMIAILAIFRAGGVYLPIDPDTPGERIAYMLNDSRAKIIIDETFFRTQRRGGPVLFPGVPGTGTNLAYMIYTSGSTGKPKGALVEHAGMMNHMWAKVRTLRVTAASIVAQTASHTFDISVWQFFAALIRGGQTIIYPDAVIMDPLKLAGLLVENGVTILELVPSYLAILLDAVENHVPPLALEYVLVTGEEIKPSLVNRWFALYPGIKMVNAYGPTEASDDITQHEITGPLDRVRHVPIGKPLQNFDIFIVDGQMQLCPVGIKGEICVAGAGVGRGYLNRPELTAENFTASFAGVRTGGAVFQKSPLVYKTGDLGRWLPDGTIEFFGRKDHQVKIRGFRIELGEIENLLVSHPAVKEAVVIDREDGHGQKYLCAYVVGSKDAVDAVDAVDTAELKAFLARTLPDYMTPAHFITLSQIPLTANGKIDRAALPAPAAPNSGRDRGMTYITAEMLGQVKMTPGTPGVLPSDNSIEGSPGIIISAEEKQQILYRFNRTEIEFPRDQTLHRLFAGQVEKTPDAVALVGPDLHISPGSSYPVNLTYRRLNRWADNLAGSLIDRGVGADDIVALRMERSVDMIAAIWGILKSGAAYLPLDPDFPKERIDYMVKDSAAKMLLTPKETKECVFAYRPAAAVAVPATADSLAYVIYTSGSTGMPKGAGIEHRSAVNFFKGMTEHLDFAAQDSVLSLITVSFDIFVLEAHFPLTRGSRVVLGSVREQVDIRAAAAMMRREKITIFQATPSLLNLFLAETGTAQALTSLKYLLVGGEELLMPVLEKARGFVTGKIFNLYGPTETTVWSTIKDVSGTHDLNIGKPIANTRVYITAANGQLQPIGAAGELCIAGEGVARGYLNRPELTAEKFTPDSWNEKDNPEEKNSKKAPLVYKTGDMACWQADGNIRFLGRQDHQIQLGGIRVELGEIESILLKQEGVTGAVVVLRRGKDGESRLRAALVSQNRLAGDRIRERLAGELPHYMIPAEFFQLEKMPLTPGGKINRKVIEALEPPETGTGDETGNNSYIAPETQLQMQIAAIWQEVLNLPKVGIHDNFFDIGGNSLGIILVNTKLKELLRRDIPALVLFEYPTIAGLSRYLEPKGVSAGETAGNGETADNNETLRAGVKNRGRDRMQQRKTKLKEERVKEERVNPNK